MPAVFKILRFRLIGSDSRPITFAKIKINMVPLSTVRRNANTVFPSTLEAHTNEYGFSEVNLYANDAMDIPTKYKVEISHTGRSYLFLIEITSDMSYIIDFEDLLDRAAMTELERCIQKKNDSGIFVTRGTKIFF